MAKKTMTASNVKVMTDGQIEGAVKQFRDAMRKHQSEISSEAAQQVLGLPNLGMRLFAPFRELAEMGSDLIVRRVKVVNRERSPREVLEAIGRTVHANDTVAQTMPRGNGEEVEVFFFRVGRFINDYDLEREYERRVLVPADGVLAGRRE